MVGHGRNKLENHLKDTIYIGLRNADGSVRILVDGKTLLRPVGSTALFEDPRGLDWSKDNSKGQELLASSILNDFMDDEKKAVDLAPSFVKALIRDLDDRGYHAGWTIIADQIHSFFGVDLVATEKRD